MIRHWTSRALVVVSAFLATVGTAPDARADGEGIGQAVGLAAGGLTALVVSPIAGGVASAASSSPKIRFWPTTGIAFGSAVVVGAVGVGLGSAFRNSDTGVWAPSVGAAMGAIGGAVVWAVVNADNRSSAPPALSVMPVSHGGVAAAAAWLF
jgi:hypothetical protein